jgi:translation initiation factor 2 beta subunit (eIF-2beta)/eIF-5
MEIQKAKKEMQDFKAFEEGLEKDGLINKKEGYTIEHKDGQLIINGKIQSQEIYDKYRSFLDNHKKFKLENDENDFGLNLD